jgi:hypothetical protein
MQEFHFKEFLFNGKQDVAVGWLALVLPVWEMPGSDLSIQTGYSS